MITYKTGADVVSMGLSIACLIHCLVLPLLFTSLPLLGVELIENRVLEGLFVLVSVLIGGYAISSGYIRFHGKWHVLGFFLAGIVLMISGNLLPFKTEAILKLSGALAIVFAHIQNWRFSKNYPRKKEASPA